ncbi:MAG: hypothetical protein VKN56_11560 [Cyanobacteriota bacterium]|nr:hypothetical protein [Cyanobacteriota bacterium]
MEDHHQRAWVTARDAGEELGISESTQARWRSSGLLKPGTRWRWKFPCPNSPVRYHLPSDEEAIGEGAARSADRLVRAVGPTRPYRYGSPCLRCLKVKQAG